MFVILAPKTDYRAVVTFVIDFAQPQREFGLTKMPDFLTLNYTDERILKKGKSVLFVFGAVTSAVEGGVIEEFSTVAVDAIGVDSRHN